MLTSGEDFYQKAFVQEHIVLWKFLLGEGDKAVMDGEQVVIGRIPSPAPEKTLEVYAKW